MNANCSPVALTVFKKSASKCEKVGPRPRWFQILNHTLLPSHPPHLPRPSNFPPLSLSPILHPASQKSVRRTRHIYARHAQRTQAVSVVLGVILIIRLRPGSRFLRRLRSDLVRSLLYLSSE